MLRSPLNKGATPVSLGQNSVMEIGHPDRGEPFGINRPSSREYPLPDGSWRDKMVSEVRSSSERHEFTCRSSPNATTEGHISELSDLRRETEPNEQVRRSSNDNDSSLSRSRVSVEENGNTVDTRDVTVIKKPVERLVFHSASSGACFPSGRRIWNDTPSPVVLLRGVRSATGVLDGGRMEVGASVRGIERVSNTGGIMTGSLPSNNERYSQQYCQPSTITIGDIMYKNDRLPDRDRASSTNIIHDGIELAGRRVCRPISRDESYTVRIGDVGEDEIHQRWVDVPLPHNDMYGNKVVETLKPDEEYFGSDRNMFANNTDNRRDSVYSDNHSEKSGNAVEWAERDLLDLQRLEYERATATMGRVNEIQPGVLPLRTVVGDYRSKPATRDAYTADDGEVWTMADQLHQARGSSCRTSLGFEGNISRIDCTRVVPAWRQKSVFRHARKSSCIGHEDDLRECSIGVCTVDEQCKQRFLPRNQSVLVDGSRKSTGERQIGNMTFQDRTLETMNQHDQSPEMGCEMSSIIPGVNHATSHTTDDVHRGRYYLRGYHMSSAVRRCPSIEDDISNNRDGGMNLLEKRPRQLLCSDTCRTNLQLAATMGAYRCDDPLPQRYNTSYTSGKSDIREISGCIGRAQRRGYAYNSEKLERENGSVSSVADYTTNYVIKPSFRHENNDHERLHHAVRFCPNMVGEETSSSVMNLERSITGRRDGGNRIPVEEIQSGICRRSPVMFRTNEESRGSRYYDSQRYQVPSRTSPGINRQHGWVGTPEGNADFHRLCHNGTENRHIYGSERRISSGTQRAYCNCHSEKRMVSCRHCNVGQCGLPRFDQRTVDNNGNHSHSSPISVAGVALTASSGDCEELTKRKETMKPQIYDGRVSTIISCSF